jgi:hypothetical protein
MEIFEVAQPSNLHYHHMLALMPRATKYLTIKRIGYENTLHLLQVYTTAVSNSPYEIISQYGIARNVENGTRS